MTVWALVRKGALEIMEVFINKTCIGIGYDNLDIELPLPTLLLLISN